MKRKKAAFPLMVIFLAIAGIGWFYYADVLGSSDGKIEGSGTLEAIEYNVSSQLAAEVADVKAEEGDKVKKGDTLLVLDDSLLEKQVAVAAAGVEAAALAVDGAGMKAEKKMAEVQLKQAEANLSMVEAQQARAIIKSPIDGVVLSLPFKEGELASPGSTLAAVGKVSELELTIYVDEKELGKVEAGQGAMIKVNAFPDKVFTGKVAKIASEAEFTPQNVQTKEQRSKLVFAVTIKVDNTEGMLKPGMPADAVVEKN